MMQEFELETAVSRPLPPTHQTISKSLLFTQHSVRVTAILHALHCLGTCPMVQLLLLMLIGLCVCVALTMSPMWPACRMADNDITVPDVDGSHSETHLWRRCRVRSAQLYPQIL